MINLFWAKGKNNAWCSLDQVDFSHSYYDNFKGFIYIIWYWNKFGEPVTIKVGQGNIRERLEAHNTDPQIQQYAHLNLLVEWVHSFRTLNLFLCHYPSVWIYCRIELTSKRVPIDAFILCKNPRKKLQ